MLGNTEAGAHLISDLSAVGKQLPAPEKKAVGKHTPTQTEYECLLSLALATLITAASLHSISVV